MHRRRRVVFHLDLDAFYAQVEHRRLGIPRDEPLAVQQWNGIIARNYPFRALGLEKGIKADELKRLHPQVHLVHVEVLQQTRNQEDKEEVIEEGDQDGREDHKASLWRYREASFEVMNSIRKFVPLRFIERASIDEAYIDLTEMLKESMFELTQEKVLGAVSRTQVLGATDGSIEDEDFRKAAAVMEMIREAVVRDTEFTMSGGIAENKLLAKIASSQHKPNKQTVVLREFATQLVRSIPMRKVPGLGRDLGRRVEEVIRSCMPEANPERKITLADVFDFNLTTEKLRRAISESEVAWLLKRAKGQDDSPVVEKMAPKSLLSAKAFKPSSDIETTKSWLHLLINELFGRAHQDFTRFARTPTKLTLYFSTKGGAFTKRLNVPKPSPFLEYSLMMQKPEKERAGVDSIREKGCIDVMNECFQIVKDLPFVARLGLQLDTFESVNVPGSWIAEDQKWRTRQQSEFRNFFSSRESMTSGQVLNFRENLERKKTLEPATKRQRVAMTIESMLSNTPSSSSSSTQSVRTLEQRETKKNAFNTMLLSSINKGSKWDKKKTKKSKR